MAGISSKILRRLLLSGWQSEWEEVDFDHSLDDLLFVEGDREWLECCGPLLAEHLRMEVFVVSHNSILNPLSSSDWLGKIIDVRLLSISNSQFRKTWLFAALLQVYGRVIQAKLPMRIPGLIGWCAAPTIRHFCLPYTWHLRTDVVTVPRSGIIYVGH